MRLKILIVLFLLLSAITSFSQSGRLLLVGGGGEKEGQSGWNVPAYRWAVAGKRVAIIGFSTGSLAPYLKQHCGANYAKEFAINTRDTANSQVLYDTLLTYQVIFFRGGDQYDYYNLYRNTKLQDAVNILYSNGGTIGGTSAGMHILSSIVFTAKNGTLYPYESIENPNNKYVTLANDFFNFAPGYIFDTHVAERARFARTVGFLAYYKMNKSIDITGMGMDDMTCMTVDANMLGTVYGTGCANIYTNGTYSLNGTKLLADKVRIVQLLQGCTFDFNTQEVTLPPLNRHLNTAALEETGNYTVLASGSNTLFENQAFLGELVTNIGMVTDSILLLTGNETLANTFNAKLIQLGAAGVNQFVINADAATNADLALKINHAKKVLFLSNTAVNFTQFLNSENGRLLNQKVHETGMISAFVGDDARFAGKTVIDNFYTEYASYYAELKFSKGLSLLANTVIMPNTFYNSDMYENSATAVPYVMAKDTLKYGIWLTNHNFMKYTPVDGKTILAGYGIAPVMVVKNIGTLAGFSTQTGTGSTSAPRMVAGFDQLELSMFDYTTPYVMGNVQVTGLNVNSDDNTFKVSPNPVTDKVNISWKYPDFNWEIRDLYGKVLKAGKSSGKSTRVYVSEFTSGLYVIKLSASGSVNTASKKFIKY